MIDFVENKEIDWQSVQELLSVSKRANRWTNFGPISQSLERYLEDFFALPPNLCVVMCASGTAALHAIANMHNYLSKKPLRWTTCSFGFPCTIQGSLIGAVAVDCDDTGRLDLKQVSDCDGLIVTNVFGTVNDWSDYQKFCSDKILVIDSATAYDVPHFANEIISFHQTKPWGMGEGGCAIIERQHKETFKELINFGVTKNGTVPFSTNGKISDFACALIYQRVTRMDALCQEYKRQYDRVVEVARATKFKLLAKCVSTPPHVPLVAPKPVCNLDNSLVKLQKYYRPQGDTPKASWLYARMVNFPCHPEVAALSDGDIYDCLNQVLEQN